VNPELERLLATLAARDNASPSDFDRAHADVERLLEPILNRLSPLGRAQFFEALSGRYRAYLKANKRPSAMPPE
jgi:hypothetical protein